MSAGSLILKAKLVMLIFSKSKTKVAVYSHALQAKRVVLIVAYNKNKLADHCLYLKAQHKIFYPHDSFLFINLF